MNNKMKVIIILSIVITLVLAVFAVTIYGVINGGVMRYIEQFPLFRIFAYGIYKPLYVEASQYPYLITWDKLDEVPKEYASTNGWFDLINNYSRTQLKRYMRENDLAIVPKDYDLDSAMDFDALMRELEFAPSS